VASGRVHPLDDRRIVVPTPVRFTCRAAGHSRSALSVADRSASAPSEPSSQASKSGPRSGAGMRSWYGVIHADPPDTITVQERISSFDAGSIQRSQSPAKSRIGEPSATVNKCGITVTLYQTPILLTKPLFCPATGGLKPLNKGLSKVSP